MTSYRPLQPVRFAELFDGTLEPFGVRGHHNKHCTANRRCLTDGNNYLWVDADDAGLLSSLTRYAPNGAPGKILSAIEEAFDVDLVSEYEPQYWGFETQEEWDAARAKDAEQSNARLYEDLMKHVRGEPSDFIPGTIGMAWAEHARALIAKDAELASPDRKTEFLAAATEASPVMRVRLTEAEIAAAKLALTHQDDLPWF